MERTIFPSIQRECRVNLPALDELYAVSDLHLGASDLKKRLCSQEVLLAGLVSHVRERAAATSGHVVLLIAGDIFDFLIDSPIVRQKDGYQPYLRSHDEAVEFLKALDKPDRCGPLFDQLGLFIKEPRCYLVMMIGNHDLELTYPQVQSWLLTRLKDPKGARVQFLTDGKPLSLKVGDARVLCVHGNEVDSSNLVDYEHLAATTSAPPLKDKRPEWKPNPGTALVIDTLNPLKAPPTLAFVDLLKPEKELVAHMMYTAFPWQLLQTNVMRFGKSSLSSVIRSLLQRIKPRGFLGAEPDPLGAAWAAGPWPPPIVRGEEILERAARQALTGVRPLDLIREDEALIETLSYKQDKSEHGPKEALRRAILSWIENDHTFDYGLKDDDYQALADRYPSSGCDFLLAGHTHLARAIRRNDGGYYFNMGTWMRLMHLTPKDLEDKDRFDEIYRAMVEQGALEDLDQCKSLIMQHPTVVRILLHERTEKQQRHVAGELCVAQEVPGLSFGGDQVPRVALIPVDTVHGPFVKP